MAEKAYPLHRRILLAIVPSVAALLIRLLASTLRIEVVSELDAHAATPEERGIWCFWHQCLLTSACCFHHSFQATILISQSFDGELIARTVHRLGFMTARGSSSRGGAAGLIDLARAIKTQSHVVFPADGPRGPRYELKAGAIKLAQMTGTPVSVFYTLPQHVWKLRSWDEFMIPKPFSRVVIAWARAVSVDRELDAAGFESARLKAQSALERARHLAEAHFAKNAPSS